MYKLGRCKKRSMCMVSVCFLILSAHIAQVYFWRRSDLITDWQFQIIFVIFIYFFNFKPNYLVCCINEKFLTVFKYWIHRNLIWLELYRKIIRYMPLNQWEYFCFLIWNLHCMGSCILTKFVYLIKNQNVHVLFFFS